MAFDVALVERVRDVVNSVGGEIEERKMFGSLAFMRNGSMVVGVIGDELMARVGPVNAREALQQDGVRPMDFTGKPMKAFVLVEQSGLTDQELRKWVDLSVEFVESLTK